MPRRFSSHHRVRAFALWTNFLLVAAVSGLLPKSAKADLFYKVEKVVKLTDSGLNPTADGSIPISVTGLNDAGWFVGYFPSATANKLHAFVWNNTSKSFLDLNNLLAADSSMATCLNDQSTVAGVFWELGTYAEKGFVYYPDGTVSTFTSPNGAGGDILAVTAINTNGDLIGSYADANGMTRGYTVQQGGNGATAIDLGNLSQPGFNQYVWPNALNDSRQIVGNVYLFPRVGRGASYTEGFFWDGGMTLIDASDLSSNWTAVAVNGSGQAVGLYGLGDLSGAPFAVTGSYFWDGQADVDLGDLGGGNGASVFALTDPGFAVGTSLSVDGTLHLFSATTGNGVSDPMVDSGSVSLYNGDTSFVPLSLYSTVVRAKPGSSATSLNDIAGFGTDAAGNTLSLLWMNNGIHSVVDLLPAYLSFSTISYAYGSRVLINDAEQIACAGTDSNGNQMALLLSVDPDTDNDGLPDSWEMQYYHHLGVDKNALETGGGGLTNWQAYQQGSDPNDFYNGKKPLLSVVSGNNQTGPPGGYAPAWLVVQVTDSSGNPLQNAAATFQVASGDGQLLKSSSAAPASSVSLQTDANGQARVAFQFSATQGVSSQITVSTGSSNHPVQTLFTETSDDGTGTYASPFAPTSLVCQTDPDLTIHLTWVNQTDDQTPVVVEVRKADGTWAAVATLAPGMTSYAIPGLQP